MYCTKFKCFNVFSQYLMRNYIIVLVEYTASMDGRITETWSWESRQKATPPKARWIESLVSKLCLILYTQIY